MNKKIKYITGTLLLITLLFVSCKNIFSQNNSATSKSDDGKTYLCLKVNNSREAYRDVAPKDKQPFDIETFTDFSLVGKHEDEEGKLLLTAVTYDDIPQKIEIMSGQWIFSLYAKFNNIEFVAEQSQYIMSGQQNKITLTLRPFEQVGGCDISFTLTDSQVSKVDVTLKSSSDGEIILDKSPLQISDNNGAKTVSFKRSMASEEERLASGRYYVKFDFYTGQEGPKGFALLNDYESYLIISDAQTTSANIMLDFNELYTITYKYITDSGEAVELVDAENFALASNSFVPFYYSKGSEITLPEAKQNKKIFLGWKNSDGQSIETIEKGSSGNLEFTAEFMDPVLYVSGTGDDSTGDGTEDNPFESIDKACEKIIEVGTPDAEWTIYIVGDVTGKNNSGKKAGQRTSSSHYARTIIPETLTSEYAKSILLTGYNGLDTDEYPQDKINRGLNGHATNGSEDGVNLVILTSVPVTINDLLIVNANNAYPNPSTVDYAFTGGGILVASNATVSLGDGVVIKDNRAKVGGGVYNAGTLFVYGTALIGDRSATQAAGDYNSGACSNSTSGDGGAGIYNSGKLYLGYSDENTPAIWDTEKGGIIYNNAYWYSAGAIYNALSGEVFFNNGVLKYNSSTFTGGAIYNLGTFHMEGGSIENNQTTSGSQCNGGGVYNANINDKGFGTFIFSGGSIKSNSTSGNGGGFYNAGEVFIYGTAVIGDKNASNLASDNTACSNYAGGSGGGIYLTSTGKCYLGYSSYTNTSDNSPETWSGSISYNYAAGDGGGIYLSGNPQVFMDSGTIANNAAAGNGDALYLCGNGFVLGGTATIPAGGGEGKPKQTVYVYSNNYSLNIDNGLSHLGAGAIALRPQDNSNSSSANASSYNTYKPLIVLTDAAKAAGVTIDAIKNKFTVESFTDPTTGIVTNWEVNSEGKAQQKTGNLTVSATGATGTYQSIADAVAAMNDTSKDYEITLDGEITGPQTIEGLSGEEIKANSITIKGKSSSSTNLKDIINASGGTGSALSINTGVPVTLSYIAIKGGCAVNGGGLFLGEGATAYVTNYTTIKENSNYSEGVNTEGKGGGVYISNEAKMIMNSVSTVCDNTGTRYGAGIYVADGGYLRMLENSESHVSYNKFISGSDQVMGGGIYLEDGAVMEHEGGYIHDNEVNADGLATGVYVNSSAIYKTMRYARLTYQNDNVPNDIYLAGDAKIELLYAMYYANSYIRRITLQNYEENKELFTLASGVSSTITYMDYFDVTSQTLTGGQKQYWAIEKNTGKLIKSSGMGITVSIPSGNDIEVTVKVIEGELVTELEPGTHFSGGKKLQFIAPDDLYDYTWKVDGIEESTDNILTVNTENWSVGNYVVYLEAQDTDGNYYSYTAQIKVEE